MPSYVRDLNELTAPASNDFFLVADTSDVLDKDKKMQLGKVPFKNGTPVAGRIATWTDANQVQDGAIAANNLSLLDTAQAFSAKKTFNAGINLGQTANLTYLDMGVWPTAPTIQASTSNPTVTYTQQDSFFMRLNTVVFYSFSVTINTISGGTGNLRISPFPFTASSLNQPRAVAIIDGVAFPGTAPFVTAFNVISSSSLGAVIVLQNNATFANLPISVFGAGDSVQASGFYYV